MRHSPEACVSLRKARSSMLFWRVIFFAALHFNLFRLLSVRSVYTRSRRGCERDKITSLSRILLRGEVDGIERVPRVMDDLNFAMITGGSGICMKIARGRSPFTRSLLTPSIARRLLSFRPVPAVSFFLYFFLSSSGDCALSLLFQINTPSL